MPLNDEDTVIFQNGGIHSPETQHHIPEDFRFHLDTMWWLYVLQKLGGYKGSNGTEYRPVEILGGFGSVLLQGSPILSLSHPQDT